MMFRLALVSLLISTAATAAPRKVAVRALTAGDGVSEKLAVTVAERVAAELRTLPEMQVSTQQEIIAALSIEQQKKLLDCDDAACNADFGGTLGVEAVVTGNLSRLGESWLVNLKLIDVLVVKTLTQSDRRLRGGSIDDVLDVLPAMTAELFGLAAPSQIPALGATEQPTGGLDVPVDMSAVAGRMLYLTDGKGRYIAWDPDEGSFDSFYAGTRDQLWAQNVFGGGRNGDSFDRIFWEPRVKARWQAAFGRTDDAFWLQCGDNKIALTAVSESEAKTLAAQAKFHAPRWQRTLRLLGRNDLGDYFLIDQPRNSTTDNLRLYVGPKGRLTSVPVDDVIADDAGELFLSAKGRLRFDKRTNALEWIDSSGSSVKLVKLAIYANAALVYSSLGAYTGQALGSACDDRL